MAFSKCSPCIMNLRWELLCFELTVVHNKPLASSKVRFSIYSNICMSFILQSFTKQTKIQSVFRYIIVYMYTVHVIESLLLEQTRFLKVNVYTKPYTSRLFYSALFVCSMCAPNMGHHTFLECQNAIRSCALILNVYTMVVIKFICGPVTD